MKDVSCGQVSDEEKVVSEIEVFDHLFALFLLKLAR